MLRNQLHSHTKLINGENFAEDGVVRYNIFVYLHSRRVRRSTLQGNYHNAKFFFKGPVFKIEFNIIVIISRWILNLILTVKGVIIVTKVGNTGW